VALNGSEFEKILIEREQHKPEFAFLRTESPYRAYYDHRVAEISKKMIQGLSAEEPKEEAKSEMPQSVKQEEAEGTAQNSFLEKIFVELREPDPEKYIAELPEKLGEG
jgi:splicing factor 3A subunit 1